MFGCVCRLYGVGVVIALSAQHLQHEAMPIVHPIDISSFLVFLGIAIFAFEGVGLVRHTNTPGMLPLTVWYLLRASQWRTRWLTPTASGSCCCWH